MSGTHGREIDSRGDIDAYFLKGVAKEGGKERRAIALSTNGNIEVIAVKHVPGGELHCSHRNDQHCREQHNGLHPDAATVFQQRSLEQLQQQPPAQRCVSASRTPHHKRTLKIGLHQQLQNK